MTFRVLVLAALLLWSHAAAAIGLNFSSPTQTSYTTTASFTVAASAEATQDYERIKSITLYRDGAVIASGTTSASASVSGLGIGTYYFTATATNSWGESVSETRVVTVEPSKVIGNIDGLSSDSSGYYLNGWACSTGLTQSIDVHVYAGGAAGAGTYVRADRADKASEAAVASACKSTGTAYRFSIPLSSAIRDEHGGKAIYVHGISPVGQPNDLISNSGTFAVPVSNNAGFVTQSVPTTMVAGQSYPVSVQMRNDGSTVWRAIEGYRLGAVGGTDNNWGQNRANLSIDVAKGGTAAINFSAKAPAAAGSYNFQWRMLREGVEWFGATTPSVSVRVVSGSISVSPNPCTIQYGASTCTSTISWSSTAADAEVWMTDANDANAQLFASGQSGSKSATTITTATTRFHLKAAGQTMAIASVSGTPAANVAPTVQLTAPTTGNNGIAPATVTFTADAADADDGVASVSFYSDDVLLGTDTTRPYSLSWGGFAAGNYNVHAVARDTLNAVTATPKVAITIVAPVVNPSSSTRHYIYDEHQQLCKVVEPETRATVMDYDAAGNLQWSAAGLELMGTAPDECDRMHASVAARKVSRTYDARNRLQHLRFPDGRGDQDWTYTPAGQPKTITTSNDGPGQTLVVNNYDYNRRGLLIGESSGQPNWYSWGVGYSYHRNGHQQGVRYPTGLYVDFGTNAFGQPTLVQSDLGVYASGIQYHPNGSIKQFTYGNGVVHSMQQNARQLPVRVTSSGGVLDFEYQYDANDNVTAIPDHALGSHTSRWMQYDGLDRLTAAGSCHFGGDCWHRFTYDRLDNLTSWKLAGVKDYAEYYYEPGTHRLISLRNSMGSAVVGFGYDEQGNLRNKNGIEHRFDYGNRLRSVHAAGGSQIEGYRYDGHGRRVLGWQPNAGSILSMYGQSGQILFDEDHRKPGIEGKEYIYLAGSLIASRERNYSSGTQAVTYHHTDALGSPGAVTNASGAVIERTQYDPYGAIVGGGKKQGIGYTGHVMDAATGLTYMQQRYYDPSIGRFLSVDPVTADPKSGGNFNRYWYANNNPYTNRDPDGRICVVAFGATTEMCARSLRYEALDSDGDIRSKTRFFGAASVVTNALAPTLGSPFLTKLSRDLEAANLGRLQGIRSGAIATSRSTRENDYAFVRFEQSAVQSRLDQLRSDSPALYSSFVGTVNGLLNGMGPRGGDPNFAKAINLAKKEVGGSLDFGNQDHREALGRAMTDVVRSSRNFCTGSRIRTC